MSNNGIHDNWDRKKKERNSRQISMKINKYNHLSDDLIREKKKASIVYNFDKNNFNNGKWWFNEGFALDEAPDNLKDNVSFVAGFNKAKRDKYVNDLAYNTGIEYRNKGVSFEELPIIYKNNPFFMKGYNTELDKTLCK